MTATSRRASATLALTWALFALSLSACARAAEWEVRVGDDATVGISHRQARVVSCGYVFWGADWDFAGARVRLGDAGGAGTPFSGEVAELGLKLSGTISRPAANTLRIAYEVEAARDLEGITGGGLQFDLKLASPSLDAAPASPVLLEGNRGWSWEAAPGKTISVAFDPPAAQVYFEQGRKETIRAFLVGSKLAQGKHAFTMTVSLPAGGAVAKSPAERYGRADTAAWHPDALPHDASPVDLSFLNEKPAGKRGFVQAAGDALRFQDGTAARFWGGNLAAYALFADKEAIRDQARRIARMGFNLMRLHHHDSMGWVNPTVIDKTRADSQTLNAEALDRVDWWIHCLKEEGVYVWLDLHVGRQLKEGDDLGEGAAEILKRPENVKGFCYYSPRIRALMQDFNRAYLTHVNPYTGLAPKDDPAIMGVLITNENDLTHHFGNLMLGDKGNPFHNRLFLNAVADFCRRTGLPPDETGKTWVPGPSKLFLNEQEHRFNQEMLAHLKETGVRVPVATTNYWGSEGLHSLPALTDGGIVDVHSYGGEEELSTNPRYEAGLIPWIAAGQVYDKPMAITEWNVPYPARDRFTTPLYLASIACLQGWDAPMVYNYSQRAFQRPNRPDTWSTYYDPAIAGVMPAAAVAYRQEHVAPARNTYCLSLSREQLFSQGRAPANSAAIRTLAEQSRLTVGLPAVKELEWLAASRPAAGVKQVNNLDEDFVPKGREEVRSDTGELRRDWVKGIQTVDTPRTQAASGWIDGETIALKDVTLAITTPKAVVALTSLDGAPIATSKRVLITAVARAVAGTGGQTAFLSEPVAGMLRVRSKVAGLRLIPLAGDGKELPAVALPAQGGEYAITLPAAGGTHWYLLAAE